MNCVACREAELRRFGEKRGYTYARCPACGTIQLCPLPKPEDLARAYERDFYGSEDAAAPDIQDHRNYRYHAAIASALKSHLPSGRVLDYGCGTGGLCSVLRDSGYDAEGVDQSPEVVSHCLDRGLKVSLGDIYSLGRDRFSAIAMCFVFEHLTEHDRWLRTCAAVLNPGGLLLTGQPTALFATIFGTLLRRLELPTLDSAFIPPWHTALFSVTGMRALARRNGFELIDVLRMPQGRFGTAARRVAQASIERANSIGWLTFGERWPLIPAHLFVLRKA